MDIEKEKADFESWATDKFPIAGLGQFEKHNNGTYIQRSIRNMYEAWQAAKAHESKKLEGCVVVPVELSESVAEKLAFEKVEKPRQENDVVWQEIADKAYSENLKIKKFEIKRDYKELVEAARGGK